MTRLKVFVIAAATLLTLLTCNAAVHGQSKAVAAETIIMNMRVRYATLSSYEDFGVVESVTEGPLAKRSTDIGFKTRFTRPNKLRFDWFDYSSIGSAEKNMVWSDGVKAFSAYGFEDLKIETAESLRMAIAGATGVSLGSAKTVPSLLSEEIGGFSLIELTKLSLKTQEIFEGEDCYVVEGYHPNGEAWQLWISKKDSLLRKLRQPGVEGDFKEQIYRNIRVEAKIPDTLYQPKVVNGRVVEEVAKEKEAEIRRLLELILPRERLNEELNIFLKMMKVMVPNAPEKTLREVLAELNFDSTMIQQIYVPIYDWHYTSEDIKQLLVLYQSSLGQKMRTNERLINFQATRRGVSIGQEFMKRIQERLRAKGFKVA